MTQCHWPFCSSCLKFQVFSLTGTSGGICAETLMATGHRGVTQWTLEYAGSIATYKSAPQVQGPVPPVPPVPWSLPSQSKPSLTRTHSREVWNLWPHGTSLHDINTLLQPFLPVSASDCKVGNGVTYRGPTSITILGVTCQAWSAQSPHTHSSFTPQSHPDKGLEGNVRALASATQSSAKPLLPLSSSF